MDEDEILNLVIVIGLCLIWFSGLILIGYLHIELLHIDNIMLTIVVGFTYGIIGSILLIKTYEKIEIKNTSVW